MAIVAEANLHSVFNAESPDTHLISASYAYRKENFKMFCDNVKT